MSDIAKGIADWIRVAMAREIKALPSKNSECRAVFCGPPAPLLERVFGLLAGGGGLLEAQAGDGGIVRFPVVLQVGCIPNGDIAANRDRSGPLHFHGLAALRNDRSAGVFLTLVPPGAQASETHESTRSSIGLAPSVSEGGASIIDWWHDPFVQGLVKQAVSNGCQNGASAAEELIRDAILAADAADKHDLSRASAWKVLERLWLAMDSELTFDRRISLATGFPPSGLSKLEPSVQKSALSALAERIEDENFGGAAQFILRNQPGEDVAARVLACLESMRSRCDVVTEIKACAPFAYSPENVLQPPAWWGTLTAEKWLELLGDSGEDLGEISLECVNAVFAHVKGMAPVVRDAVHLRLHVPNELIGEELQLVREVPGNAAGRREWVLNAESSIDIQDEQLPEHRSPVRYAASCASGNAKKVSLKVVSLASWVPGVVVGSTTATKGGLPKIHKDRTIQSSFMMSGQGRHYLDLWFRPGVMPAQLSMVGLDHRGNRDPAQSFELRPVADDEFGVEIEIEDEGTFELEIKDPEDEKLHVFRIVASADEASPDECGSHFELQLLKNSNGRKPSAVHVDGQARSAQLQGWMLDADRVSRSFYPFVIAEDYARAWKRTPWSSAGDTIFSRARFLGDPRPAPDAISPPQDFLVARSLIATRVRGKDGNGLLEGAPLGEWLATDAAFATEVDDYLRAYQGWLASAPDEAVWVDLGLVCRIEADGKTLFREPDAILMSPLHPIRLAWHCIAQRAMFIAGRKKPCPAASIMDPDCVPDCVTLPLLNAMGGQTKIPYFAIECNSDYWSVLWNSQRLDLLASHGPKAPLDREFGIEVGSISGGFSVSQVNKSLDDICSMLVAKPVLGVLVSSTSSKNSACNRGILSWARAQFEANGGAQASRPWIGAKEVRIYDDRQPELRPDDVEISNLTEDTANALQWFAGSPKGETPDLAIIAQLETTNATALATKLSSPVGFGALVRRRIREPSGLAGGQLLRESRMSATPPSLGDAFVDRAAASIAALENLSDERLGYVFAPSVHAITKALDNAEFAAVSSSAVDPACFLGGWLADTYLWDYELPAYSGRAGDSNGYYLLSRIKELDLETLSAVIKGFPGCGGVPYATLSGIVEEVARRGIPTVRGLSAGNSGATGDLGLLVATRLLQDSFRAVPVDGGLIHPWTKSGEVDLVSLVIPVDPFQGYLDDLARSLKRQLHRPDLLVASFLVGPMQVCCKLTPVEVKNRLGAQMSAADRQAALAQAASLSTLMDDLIAIFEKDPDLLLWRIAFQTLLASMIDYGFRVYSQRIAAQGKAAEWSELHARVIEEVLGAGLRLEVDKVGRLIVIDGSTASAPRDIDGDRFHETIELSHKDAALFIRGEHAELEAAMREKVLDWNLYPKGASPGGRATFPPPLPERLDSGHDEPDGDKIAEAAAPMPSDGLPAVEPLAPTAVNAEEAEQEGLILRIGETIDGFTTESRFLNLGDTALNQMNMGVVGDLGTGKTQLLKSLVYQIARGSAGNRDVPPNVLIFDYKKDYSSADFVEATGARIVKPNQIPLNLFDLSGAAQTVKPEMERYRFFADVIDKIFSGVGPVQRDRLKTAIKVAYADAQGGAYPTIDDIHKNYVDLMKGSADSLSGILGDLVDMELFTSDAKKTVPVHEFLKGVVVISLNELGQDDRTKNMLVAILLNVFYEHMLQIPKRPYLGAENNRRVVDSMLLVDEADNIMKYEFDVMRKVLLQGREFGVGVILASQYLSHFKAGATDYREPLLTWFIHKVPNVKPQELSALGISEASGLPQLAERIRQLTIHQCLYKTFDVNGEFVFGSPFYRRNEWLSGI